MKKLIGIIVALGLVTGTSVFAFEAIEVDHLIKCEDGSDLMSAVKDSNSNFARGEVYASIYKTNPDGTGSGDQLVVVKKPFKVSAPFVYHNPQGAVRVCVTVSKE